MSNLINTCCCCRLITQVTIESLRPDCSFLLKCFILKSSKKILMLIGRHSFTVVSSSISISSISIIK